MSLWAFRFLLWYICILLVQPQNRFYFLYPLHIADISIIGALVLHVFACMQNGKPLIRMGPATISGLVLLVAAFLSLYTGVYQTYTGWNPYIDILAKNALVMILLEAMATSVARIWAVQAITMIATLWWVKAGLRLSAAGMTFAGDRLMGPAVSLVENPNGFAYMMCVFLPSYLYFYQTSRHKYLKWAFLALSLIGVYIVFETGSRTGLLTLIVMGAGLFPKYAGRHKVGLIVSVVAIYFILSLVSPGNISRFKSIGDSIRSFFSGEIKADEDMTQDEQSAQERRLKMRDTWALIKEYPLFGVGINPNESLFVSRYPFAGGQVHCEILMAGRQMGLIGMSLYVVMIAIMAGYGHRIQHALSADWPDVADLGWTFKIQALAFIVGGYFSPVPWNPAMLIIVALASALWLNLLESGEASAPGGAVAGRPAGDSVSHA